GQKPDKTFFLHSYTTKDDIERNSLFTKSVFSGGYLF
ncbi:unnamed protein product, partial [marine sediment metagenome]